MNDHRRIALRERLDAAVEPLRRHAGLGNPQYNTTADCIVAAVMAVLDEHEAPAAKPDKKGK